ncbi:MAG: choice-of-anchor D domain-containing protein, partial [Planctomycetes bacterium]|nr:choice-of-anchor D domain-containing protein [Planctomycetota bacterium]
MNRMLALSMLIMTLLIFSCSSENKTLKASPSSLDFEQVNIGDSVNLQIVLKNKYGKDLIISNINLAGSTDFSIVTGANVPINLLKNTEHILEIKFEPTSAGLLYSLLTIVHDASTKPKEIDLDGEGIPVPRMSLSDMSYDFGVIYVSRDATHDFEVSNVGTADLTINNLGLIGASAFLYSIPVGNAPFTITPGNKHTFTLQFSPLTDGAFPITLEIIHDAVNEATPLSIPIEGEGVTFAPEITFGETSPWDIGSHSTAAPSIHDFEITSSGIDPLTVTSATFVTATIFSLDEVQDKNGNVVNLPQTIPVGDKITLKIKFTPIANAIYNDTLTIVHDAINEAIPFD